MLNYWNNLPSAAKDVVRFLATVIVAYLTQLGVYKPATINVQPPTSPPPVIYVQPSVPVVNFTAPPPPADK